MRDFGTHPYEEDHDPLVLPDLPGLRDEEDGVIGAVRLQTADLLQGLPQPEMVHHLQAGLG